MNDYDITLRGLHKLLATPGVKFKMDLGKLYSLTMKLRNEELDKEYEAAHERKKNE